jgi:hypothetical protein
MEGETMSQQIDLIETLRTLRNAATDAGDMEAAYRHERRLQILVGLPSSFTANMSGHCRATSNGCQGMAECFCDCDLCMEADETFNDFNPFENSDAEELADLGREDF